MHNENKKKSDDNGTNYSEIQKKAAQVLRDTFKSYFNWPDADVESVVNVIVQKTFEINIKDYHQTIDLADDLIQIFQNKRENPSPGTFITAVKNKLTDLWRKKDRLSYYDDLNKLGKNIQNAIEESKQFETAGEGLKAFFDWAEQNAEFTQQEKICFQLLQFIVSREVDSTRETESFRHKEIWHELLDLAQDRNIILRDAAFRKMKQRLIAKLKEGSSNLHSFVPNNVANGAFFEFILTSSFEKQEKAINRVAYRFSLEELDGIKQLIQLFNNGGESNDPARRLLAHSDNKIRYTFDPNRIPEVYYEDSLSKVDFDFSINPDLLGCYRYEFETNPVQFNTISKEGTIHLFKDKIEAVSARTSISVDSIRYVVLMHELGHWLTHQAVYEGIKWNKGFHIDNKKTKEALAQLIAYWACGNNAIHFATLTELSPKKKDGTSAIDTDDAYGAYRSLIDKPSEEILRKLSDLARHWYLPDEMMYQYLLSPLDFESFSKLISSTLKNNESSDSMLIKLFSAREMNVVYFKELHSMEFYKNEINN